MGISCDISICTPAGDGYAFYPGTIVSGGIRYCLDVEYEFTLITVSLKGYGKLFFEDRARSRRDRWNKLYNTETYVDINNIIHKKEDKALSKGQYETQFSFQLPFDIPASLDYTRLTIDEYARCTIHYYVLIQFERPGLFQFNKQYKQVIKVIAGQTQIPRMNMSPLIYGEQKRLKQLSSIFSKKKEKVNLKATIAKSVLRPKETIKVDYEVKNNSNVEIKRVEVSLLEVDTYFLSGGRKVMVKSEIEHTGYVFAAIPNEGTTRFTAEISIPSLCQSIDHSKIISRDYAVLTAVVLPMPHDNMTLEIPFQVMKRLSSSLREGNTSTTVSELPVDDAPPSYWEVMSEQNNDSARDVGEMH